MQWSANLFEEGLKKMKNVSEQPFSDQELAEINWKKICDEVYEHLKTAIHRIPANKSKLAIALTKKRD